MNTKAENTLYIPRPGERFRVVEVHPEIEHPVHAVGDELDHESCRYVRESPGCPGWLYLETCAGLTLCRVAPATPAEEPWIPAVGDLVEGVGIVSGDLRSGQFVRYHGHQRGPAALVVCRSGRYVHLRRDSLRRAVEPAPEVEPSQPDDAERDVMAIRHAQDDARIAALMLARDAARKRKVAGLLAEMGRPVGERHPSDWIAEDAEELYVS